MSRRTFRASAGPPIDQAPGDFIAPSGLLSPPPSSIASSSVVGSSLPTPRQHPLKSGSPKEAAYINYVDKGMQEIGRKFALRNTTSEGQNEHGMGARWQQEQQLLNSEEPHGRPGREEGYTSFREAARDLRKLVDVVWVSGTLSLQVPHLLSLALLVLTYISAFPTAPRSLFGLLDKLDSAFASLILGQDVQTGQSLPSSEGDGRRSKVSGTEKVRIKSLVERTRVAVVEAMAGADVYDIGDENEGAEVVGPHERGNGDDVETETESNGEDYMEIDAGFEDRNWEMEVARVYARTLNELGDELVGPAIGI